MWIIFDRSFSIDYVIDLLSLLMSSTIWRTLIETYIILVIEGVVDLHLSELLEVQVNLLNCGLLLQVEKVEKHLQFFLTTSCQERIIH
jgi:hypothetical protein